jgi:hypothetical protein
MAAVAITEIRLLSVGLADRWLGIFNSPFFMQRAHLYTIFGKHCP